MDSNEILRARKRLGKTQKQMSILLGNSLKAIISYEQGWRSIPPYIERQVFFLISRTPDNLKALKTCWKILKCPIKLRHQCPAWEYGAGEFCWFINGTICAGYVQKNWKEKMALCRSCEVMLPLLQYIGSEI